MQIYVNDTFFSTSITNYLCLVQQHLIGTPFQLRITRFSFFHDRLGVQHYSKERLNVSQFTKLY